MEVPHPFWGARKGWMLRDNAFPSRTLLTAAPAFPVVLAVSLSRGHLPGAV